MKNKFSFLIKFFTFYLCFSSFNTSFASENNDKFSEQIEQDCKKQRLSTIRKEIEESGYKRDFVKAAELGSCLLKDESCTYDDQKKIIHLYCCAGQYQKALNLSQILIEKSSAVKREDHLIFLKTFVHGFHHLSEDERKKLFPEIQKSCKYLSPPLDDQEIIYISRLHLLHQGKKMPVCNDIEEILRLKRNH